MNALYPYKEGKQQQQLLLQVTSTIHPDKEISLVGMKVLAMIMSKGTSLFWCLLLSVGLCERGHS